MVLGIGDAEIFHSLKLWNWQANLRAADRQEAWTSPIDKKTDLLELSKAPANFIFCTNQVHSAGIAPAILVGVKSLNVSSVS